MVTYTTVMILCGLSCMIGLAVGYIIGYFIQKRECIEAQKCKSACIEWLNGLEHRKKNK